MTPSLATFPDRCLETIFKNTPLVDLYFSVGLVCKSWYSSRLPVLARYSRLVLVDIAKQDQLNQYRVDCSTFATELIELVRRDDGTLWHTHESQERFIFNLLLVPAGLHQTDPFFGSLITNFHTLTHLHVVHDCTASVLTGVILLVDHLSGHLVDLKIILSRPVVSFEFDDGDHLFEADDADLEDDDDEDGDAVTPDCAAKLLNLITSLNLLRSLRHLKLQLFFGKERLVLPPLTCLAHLTTFSFHIDEFRWVGDWVFTSVNDHAHNVTAISLTSSRGALGIPRILARVDHQLDPKFAFISAQLDDFIEPVLPVQRIDSLGQFCTRFSGLTKLVLISSFFSIPMTELARCLSLCPQLVHLDLPFGTIPPLLEAFGYRRRGRQAQEEVAQVFSVRLLSLSFSTSSHNNTERLQIAEIFPNLQVLRLEHRFYRCQVCGIVRRDDGEPHRYEDSPPELAPRIAECSRLARQPFRQCLHLHTLALVDGNTDTLLNVAEM